MSEYGGKAPPGAKMTPSAASREAFAGVQPSLRNSQRNLLKLFLLEGPMAEPQMRAASTKHSIFMSESGMRTRRRELADMGLLEDTNTYIILPTGNKAIVWRLTEKGKNIAHGL